MVALASLTLALGLVGILLHEPTLLGLSGAGWRIALSVAAIRWVNLLIRYNLGMPLSQTAVREERLYGGSSIAMLVVYFCVVSQSR